MMMEGRLFFHNAPCWLTTILLSLPPSCLPVVKPKWPALTSAHAAAAAAAASTERLVVGTPPQVPPPSDSAADFIPVTDGCHRQGVNQPRPNEKQLCECSSSASAAAPRHADSNENGMFPRLTQRWSAAQDFSEAFVRCD